ncbi:amidohydrolase [Coprococcus eutactus]|nr:amidohydrolase [Coprococcus eutactus]
MDKRAQYIDKQIIEQIMELRKQLHRIPEHSMQEVKTKQMLMDFLKLHTALEIVDHGAWFYAVKRAYDRVTTENDKTFDVSEVAAEIPEQMTEYKPPIAFRADMDAVCGKDGKPGHFCGHDGHSSVLCGLGLYLDSGKEPLAQDVYLIFQPAEEIGKGAELCRSLIKEKHIGEIYGFHNIPGKPLGTVLVKDGTFACASTGLEIHMTGTPSHAAYPEAGRNPGYALARLLLQIEELTEHFNETRGFVRMTLIGMELGSKNYGVAASDGYLRLTVRSGGEQVFREYLAEIRKLAEVMAQKEALELSIKEIERFPSTDNHAEQVQKIRACAASHQIPYIELPEPMRWSEDFGWYLQETKGAFFGIGDGEDYVQLHTEHFEFPDSILETAVTMFAGLCVDIKEGEC